MALSPKHFYELMDMHFIIPSYQRGYRWDKEQVEDLLNDLEEFILTVENREGKDVLSYYCLQPMTVVPEPGSNGKSYYIIDGQQRLTTIYLLLRYLLQRSLMENQPIFSLSLPSRKEQDEYLNGNEFMDESFGYESNIDNFYVYMAYETIKTWFAQNKVRPFLVQDFLKILMSPPRHNNADKEKDVRVIWYEISNATALQAFRRLNYGKIPLTSSELVKALLLQKGNYSEWNDIQQTTASTRAVEWDDMEHTLQNPYLWSMLSKADKKEDTTSKMELILDFVADALNKEMRTDEGKLPFVRKDARLLKGSDDLRDYFDYHVINKYLHNKPQHLHERIEEVWKRIRDTFNLISNWYDNRTWYHLIGLIRILQDRNKQRSGHNFIEYIYRLSTTKDGQPLDRPTFTDNLKTVIGNALRLDNDKALDKLNYNDDSKQMVKILLALNVKEAMDNDIEGGRIPFYLIDRYNITSLDHIHPQNITREASYKDFVNWFGQRSECIDCLTPGEWKQAAGSQEQEETAETWQKRVESLKKEVEKAQAEIRNIISDESKYTDDANQSLLDNAAKTIDKLFGDISGITDKDLHSISNMALVDVPTNSALQNYFLDKKRSILMERHSKCTKLISGKPSPDSTYVPPATRRVYSKDYSRESPGDMRLWRREDRANYMKAIESTYLYFVNPNKP